MSDDVTPATLDAAWDALADAIDSDEEYASARGPIETHRPAIEAAIEAQAREQGRASLDVAAVLDSLDIIDGILDDTHPEGDGCPLCRELDNLRARLAADSEGS